MLKATTTRRDSDGQKSSSHFVYRYDKPEGSQDETGFGVLSAAFDPTSVQSILARSEPWGGHAAVASVNELITRENHPISQSPDWVQIGGHKAPVSHWAPRSWSYHATADFNPPD